MGMVISASNVATRKAPCAATVTAQAHTTRASRQKLAWFAVAQFISKYRYTLKLAGAMLLSKACRWDEMLCSRHGLELLGHEVGFDLRRQRVGAGQDPVSANLKSFIKRLRPRPPCRGARGIGALCSFSDTKTSCPGGELPLVSHPLTSYVSYDCVRRIVLKNVLLCRSMAHFTGPSGPCNVFRFAA